jgi:hypothetical protein
MQPASCNADRSIVLHTSQQQPANQPASQPSSLQRGRQRRSVGLGHAAACAPPLFCADQHNGWSARSGGCREWRGSTTPPVQHPCATPIVCSARGWWRGAHRCTPYTLHGSPAPPTNGGRRPCAAFSGRVLIMEGATTDL